MTYKYFTDKELACQGGPCCGGEQKMNTVFMNKLDQIRHRLGFPLRVTSGYRCPAHNANISHTGTTGPHTTGRAVDIAIQGEDAFKLIEIAMAFGMTGIGVSQKGNKRFIHIDDLEHGLRPRVWSY